MWRQNKFHLQNYMFVCTMSLGCSGQVGACADSQVLQYEGCLARTSCAGNLFGDSNRRQKI